MHYNVKNVFFCLYSRTFIVSPAMRPPRIPVRSTPMTRRQRFQKNSRGSYPWTLTAWGGDPSRTQHPARFLAGRGAQAPRCWDLSWSPHLFSRGCAPDGKVTATSAGIVAAVRARALLSSVCATTVDNSGVYVYYLKGIVSVCFRCPARTVGFSGTRLCSSHDSLHFLALFSFSFTV